MVEQTPDDVRVEQVAEACRAYLAAEPGKRLAAYFDVMAGIRPERQDWVDCPICGESDMRAQWFRNDEGPYIHCVNLGCPSNRLSSTRPSDESVEALKAQIVNTPETADFMAGVPIEALHQRERWGADHDAGKQPLDWFWLIGYLAQKAATAAIAGDLDKAKHHTISTAAALANWHCALDGTDNRMRPGIVPPAALSTSNSQEPTS